MKYFTELSSEDKERCLNKLMFKPSYVFTKLLRVYAPLVTDNNELQTVKPAWVASFYWDQDDLFCSVVFDHDQSRAEFGFRPKELKPCFMPDIDPVRLDHVNSGIAKRALIELLMSSKSYVFDDRCNAYPI